MKSLEEQLEDEFKRARERAPYGRERCFLYVSMQGVTGTTRYGSFKTVYKDELEKRQVPARTR